MREFCSFIVRCALAITAFATAISVGSSTNFAARNSLNDEKAASAFELIVFERRSSCLICAVFRRDVGTDYVRSAWQDELPLRYVDITAPTISDATRPHPGLVRPLTQMPTAVILRDGREVARIEGYTGPKIFLQALRAARRRY